MTEVKRRDRVSERIREELAEMLAREVRDPRAQGVVITRVQVTDDLQRARIWVRLLVDSGAPEPRENLTKALEHMKPRLRAQLGKRAELRRAPDLAFHYDDGQDASTRIEALLYEIEREKKPVGDA